MWHILPSDNGTFDRGKISPWCLWGMRSCVVSGTRSRRRVRSELVVLYWLCCTSCVGLVGFCDDVMSGPLERREETKW